MARTFDTKREAEEWATKIEAALSGGKPAAHAMTVADMIQEYRRAREFLGLPIAPESNTHYMLAHLDEDLGPELLEDLTPRRLAEWARMRHEQGAGGYTVNMELSALGTAIRHTASFMNVQLPDVVGPARPLLHYGQLISGGNRRTRRPTDDELSALLRWIEDNRGQVHADAVRVAAITGMRRGELARIAWADVDDRRRAVLVRARKHPRRIEARDEWVPLLGDAWDIVQRQPRTGERIFPLSREAMTDAVTDGTRALGIPDLHLHDMRRHATSKLRELGFDADARKAVTGHRSDEIHSRYVAVSVEQLHEQYAAATQGSRPSRQRRKSASAPRPESSRTPREPGGS